MNLNLTTMTEYQYPPSFFMPEMEDSCTEDLQWEIRDLITELERNENYTEAAKLCIKLLVNSITRPIAMPSDLKLLNNIIYKQIDSLAQEQLGSTRTSIMDYNFAEIQTILWSCKNQTYLNAQDEARYSFVIEHLNSKTKDLAETIDNLTNKAQLLLKTKTDEQSNLEVLPPDAIQEIAMQCLAIIAKIGQTPVDISNEEPFPM